MAAFFVKSGETYAGPFTGVELREATLAGIVGPETLIGAGPGGPWTKAGEAGLFSGKKLPLPHPPGTHVPAYQVRGMHGGLTGPFKLRELIGFAARGMLPAEAMLQSDLSPEWISLNRIPVLVACLSGRLVLLGEKSPLSSIQSIDITKSSAHRRDDNQSQSEVLIVGDEGLVIEEDGEEEFVEPESIEPTETPNSTRRRIRLPPVRLSIPYSVQPRLIVRALCLLLAVACIGAAYSYWRNLGMSSDEILGDWMGGGESGVPTFGISFREDSHCIVFNSQGESWSGDYAWITRTDDSAGLEEIKPFSSQVDLIDQAHQRGPIHATDGYIRLRGFVDQPPMIGGHRIRDCFLRRDGETLRIGYLANVTWTRNAKTMEAGWMSVQPLPLPVRQKADLVSDLMSMDVEEPPVTGYAVEQSPHISQAIAELQNSLEADIADGDVGNGSTCFSVRVNAEYLLRTYGIPDEARPAYSFEIPELAIAQSFEGTQVVLYGNLKLFIRPDGTIQYVSIML